MYNSPILAEALGNTFLIFDCLQGPIPDEIFFLQAHKKLIESARDDALILVVHCIERKKLYLHMKVLGVDGKFGEFCGNGSRAVAAYLFQTYPEFEEFFLVKGKDFIPLYTLGKGLYASFLPPIALHGVYVFQGLELYYGDAAKEPHLIHYGKMSAKELVSLGRKLNASSDFSDGINVSCCISIKEGIIGVTTYERGVQRLTASCATGSSVAAYGYLMNKAQSTGEVLVETPGGPLCIKVENTHIVLTGFATAG